MWKGIIKRKIVLFAGCMVACACSGGIQYPDDGGYSDDDGSDSDASAAKVIIRKSDGRLLVGGETRGKLNSSVPWFAEIDENGNISMEWRADIEDPLSLNAMIEGDSPESVVIAGMSNTFGGGNSAYAAKMDFSDGTRILWQKKFGDSNLGGVSCFNAALKRGGLYFLFGAGPSALSPWASYWTTVNDSGQGGGFFPEDFGTDLSSAYLAATALDGGRILATGGVNSGTSALLMLIDQNGNPSERMERKICGGSGGITDVVFSRNGEVVGVGDIVISDGHEERKEICIVKMDPSDLALRWEKSFTVEAGSHDEAFAIDVSASNIMVIGGRYSDKNGNFGFVSCFDESGEQLWKWSVTCSEFDPFSCAANIRDVKFTVDGGVLAAGYTSDGFILAKFDASGKELNLLRGHAFSPVH